MDDQLLQATLDSLRRSAAQNQAALGGPAAAQPTPGPMGGGVGPVPEPVPDASQDLAALQASDAQVSGQLAQGATYPSLGSGLVRENPYGPPMPPSPAPPMGGAADMSSGIVTTNPYGDVPPIPPPPQMAATPPTFIPEPMGMQQQLGSAVTDVERNRYMFPFTGAAATPVEQQYIGGGAPGQANPYGPPAPMSVPNQSGGLNFYGPQHAPVGYDGNNPYLQQLLQRMGGGRF